MKDSIEKLRALVPQAPEVIGSTEVNDDKDIITRLRELGKEMPIHILEEAAVEIERYRHEAGLIVCHECGKWFRPKTRRSMFCSLRCKDRLHSRKRRDRICRGK